MLEILTKGEKAFKEEHQRRIESYFEAITGNRPGYTLEKLEEYKEHKAVVIWEVQDSGSFFSWGNNVLEAKKGALKQVDEQIEYLSKRLRALVKMRKKIEEK